MPLAPATSRWMALLVAQLDLLFGRATATGHDCKCTHHRHRDAHTCSIVPQRRRC